MRINLGLEIRYLIQLSRTGHAPGKHSPFNLCTHVGTQGALLMIPETAGACRMHGGSSTLKWVLIHACEGWGAHMQAHYSYSLVPCSPVLAEWNHHATKSPIQPDELGVYLVSKNTIFLLKAKQHGNRSPQSIIKQNIQEGRQTMICCNL